MKSVVIERPQVEFPEKNLKKAIYAEIGGIFGFGSSKFTADVTFPKNQYYTNEILRANLSCDNSNCKKSVKETKINILRNYTIRTNGAGFSGPRNTKIVDAKHDSSLGKMKFPGCKAKTQKKVAIGIKVPNYNPGFSLNHKFLKFDA